MSNFNKKTIAILGAGNVGCTLAADLSRKGHNVYLVKTSRSFHNENFDFIKEKGYIEVNDIYIGKYISTIPKIYECEFETPISSADIIIIATQTNYHEDIITKISPFLHHGQIVLFEPGYLSTCFLLNHFNKNIISIEAESSPIDCRISASGKVSVLFKNVINPFGVYPLSRKKAAHEALESLGFPFRFTANVFEAALHNPNLIVHTVGALFSIPRIEYTKGDYWMYREVFTPHVWNVCESLDKEKIDVLSSLGIEHSQRYVEACQERNFINDSRDPFDAFMDYAIHSSPKGPSIPDSRYLTEDVSQGLVLLESIGHFLGLTTPTASSLITLASEALKYDFRRNGRTITKLGSDTMRIILNDFCSHKDDN